MIKVIYNSDSTSASTIRTLFCVESLNKDNLPAGNPLLETNFNEHLDIIVQEAFDKGRAYERNLTTN